MSQRSQSDDEENTVEKTQEEYVLEMLQYFHVCNSIINHDYGNSAANRVNEQWRYTLDACRPPYLPLGEVGPEVDLDVLPPLPPLPKENKNGSSRKNSNNNNKQK
uniref:Uncharacterized protein n=1 Tax=Schizaphis graminum TaxID=13262 RepID=A0A2S2NEF1_SCHGA